VVAPLRRIMGRLIAGVENIVYFVLSVVFFQYTYWRSRETGHFAPYQEERHSSDLRSSLTYLLSDRSPVECPPELGDPPASQSKEVLPGAGHGLTCRRYSEDLLAMRARQGPTCGAALVRCHQVLDVEVWFTSAR
jgi:hypothetical protein